LKKTIFKVFDEAEPDEVPEGSCQGFSLEGGMHDGWLKEGDGQPEEFTWDGCVLASPDLSKAEAIQSSRPRNAMAPPA
jgi:hypothetical protein